MSKRKCNILLCVLCLHSGNIVAMLCACMYYDNVLGAYGTVYKARDLLKGGQIVAMKKVKVALTEDGIPLSTLREIALLQQLGAYKHPNIVR